MGVVVNPSRPAGGHLWLSTIRYEPEEFPTTSIDDLLLLSVRAKGVDGDLTAPKSNGWRIGF
jgi:hypothetical protein